MTEKLIPIFKVRDATKTAEWYKRLGFQIIGEHRFAPNMPLYIFLERNGEELHLSEHEGDAKGSTLVYYWVDDIGLIAAEFKVEIFQQPWAKEISLEDPDGNRLRIGQRSSGIE